MNKIAIHSVPRSGSTWLGEIFNSSPNVKYCYQPLFSYAFKNFLNNSSTKEDLELFFKKILVSEDDYLNRTDLRKIGALPELGNKELYTHVCYKEVRHINLITHLLKISDDMKFIFLIRNPIEVMNSWINTPSEFDYSWKIDEEILDAPKKNAGYEENFFGLNSWIKTTLLFKELDSKYENVYLINYKDLIQNTRQTIQDIFKFCNLKINKETYSFIDQSLSIQNDNPHSVFKGKKRNGLTLDKNIVKLIKDKVSKNNLTNYLE
jgi:hypothetical protein